ncbi:phosphoribosylglycinamide formyltransferase [Desulfuromonas thiophila]|uniref:Phosphoribosylglycinamide formyltransferase n=1 Tax=Desulfuromonas thiophila TaxID=57664 RepID=A0A1G7CX19_9BACT|nr:phosphoribosylglycinamide formyltransferase [Desulfuromonas thiophila]SDE43872.1 formyltetrahydrofolate-dependent phosphoribosylglycinamide formyltransferase [Desulfuromonas thiophila]
MSQPAPQPIRLGVLASGGGTNLQSIIDACAANQIAARIACVLSNNPDAGALQRAARAGLVHECLDHRQFSCRQDFDAAMVARLQHHQVDLVVLAGFMRIVGPAFIEAFPQRILNIHPALLPAFPGLHVQKKALDYGVRFAGCTVHFVDGGVDTGPIIVQAVVPVLDNDTEESLSARILEQEHRIYPYAIDLFARGALEIAGRRVRIRAELAAGPQPTLIQPPLPR